MPYIGGMEYRVAVVILTLGPSATDSILAPEFSRGQQRIHAF